MILRFGRRPGSRRLAAAGVVLAALTALLAGPAAPAGAAVPFVTCSVHTLTVRIADPGPATSTMSGELCYAGRHEPSTVQLLVHGATYNHLYWDFPVGGGYYSYARIAALAGYATFAVDRIGVGNSSRPHSSVLDMTAGAVALHDAITALRAGAVDGHQFGHVIWVGHSLGSIMGWLEISRYHDVDATILTGASHGLNPAGSAAAQLDIYPVTGDPKFAGSGLDPGYLTTRPGTRGTLFYDLATTDPAVLAADEATKDTVTAPEFGQAFGLFALPAADAPSQQITVPVLLVLGQQDSLFCGHPGTDCSTPASVVRTESQFYPAQAHLRAVVIPATGHDVALSTTAPLADVAMLAWSFGVVRP